MPIEEKDEPVKDNETGNKTPSTDAHESPGKKNFEPVEITQNKNGDAAAEEQEGNFGKRSYADPGFDDEE